jgi:probable rRNA maturation factor
MISYICEDSLVKEFKKTGIARKKWYADIHEVSVEVLKKSPRYLQEIYDISIVLVTEEKMKALYAMYKRINRVTDVLSFFYGKSEEDTHPQGELYICLSQALRQARRYRVSPVQEVARLVIHGFLHIYGYDHQKKHERAVMQSLERVIFHICKKERML